MAIYPQPGVPFAKIYFGNVEVTSFPDLSLQSFEYNRGDSQHGGNSVQFTLIDQEWTTLELLLLKAKGAIEFETFRPEQKFTEKYANPLSKIISRIKINPKYKKLKKMRKMGREVHANK